MCTHMYVEVVRQLARVNLSFYHVILKNQDLVVRLGGKFPFLMSLHASPPKHFLNSSFSVEVPSFLQGG